MNESSSSQLYLGENPCRRADAAKAIARAYLWLVGAGTLVGVLVFAVASQSSLDAARIAGADGGYAATPRLGDRRHAGPPPALTGWSVPPDAAPDFLSDFRERPGSPSP